MASNEATKEFSSKQEQTVAYELNWDVVTGSGARPCTPGDVICDDWLGECKTHTTRNNPIAFNHEVWVKLNNEAMMKHRAPALIVDDGSQRLCNTWVLCHKHAISKMSDVMFIDFFKLIRKNISFDKDEAQVVLNNALEGNEFPFIQYVMFETQWEGDTVAVMPFNTFKEIYNR